MQASATREAPPAVSVRSLKELVAAGTVPSAKVISAEQGLLVVLQIGSNEWVMGASRGGAPRYFQSFDGAASALQQVGIRQFTVDTTDWTPKTMRDKPVTA